MSLNRIALRQAGPCDWSAVSRLLAANKLPLDGAQSHISNFVLATSGGEVIGCAGAEVHGDISLLRSVAVDPALHGRSVGRAMVGVLLDEARRRSIQRVYLLTTTAAHYFTRLGFIAVPRAAAPEALQRSAEFDGACPGSATLMELTFSKNCKPTSSELPVAVIGAGPVGLAALARLIERGIPALLIEAGETVGANLLDYGHVRLFSPWQFNVDRAMAKLLQPTGWQAPSPNDLPYAHEVVEQVLQPFAHLPQVASALKLRTRVTSISREGFDKVKTREREKSPFIIHAMHDGNPVVYRARAVIDSSGTWNTPNPLGASGLPAMGEKEFASRIFYGIPDVLGRDMRRYAGKRTLVVGAGHSAANALLSLSELARKYAGTRLAWSVRSPVLTRVFGGGDADALPARGRLGSQLKALRDSGGLEFVSGLRITQLHAAADGTVIVSGLDVQGKRGELVDIDEIICATGQRPDLQMTRELRLRLDPMLESTEALAALIDPNEHSCGTVRPHGHRELSHPEPGFYTVGVKSYGRAPTFLMSTGFEQARSVVAAIAGDMDAADRVELQLPETGVCSVNITEPGGVSSGGGCCGSPPKQKESACRAPNEPNKTEGNTVGSCASAAPVQAPGTKPDLINASAVGAGDFSLQKA
jgi:N-acetylglutamate synthase-like GNAT family acetyltransferase/thioredoxin reductase